MRLCDVGFFLGYVYCYMLLFSWSSFVWRLLCGMISKRQPFQSFSGRIVQWSAERAKKERCASGDVTSGTFFDGTAGHPDSARDAGEVHDVLERDVDHIIAFFHRE